MTTAIYHQHTEFSDLLKIAALVPASFILGMVLGVLLGTVTF